MLERLLCPATVAVVGASRTPGKVGHEAMANLIRGRFPGTIIPVNPSGEEIIGIRSVASLADCDHEIDLCLIAVPASVVLDAVTAAVDAKVGAICIITAGFKEVGPAGAELEERLAGYCKSRGVRLLGPNCLGVINTQRHLNASFAKQMPEEGSISVVSQSGALCAAILDWAAARRVGLSKLISIGNKADLDERDFVTELAADSDTRVIVAYLESIASGKEFVQVAAAAAAIKPVVVLKAGTSNAGARAASSHTGSLAGADIAYGAAFRRSGIIRAGTFEALLDYATALAMQPLPRGDRVAIITNAGGPGIMAADAVENCGMQVATLSDRTAALLRSTLPVAASVANPIDVLCDADPQRYVEAIRAVQNDDGVDAIVLLLTPQAMTDPAGTARAAAQFYNGTKPLLTSFLGGREVMPAREILVRADVPEYPAPERAVAALKAMCDYAEWRRLPPRIVTRFPVNRRRAERILNRCLRAGECQVNEAAAKEIMLAYRFNVPEGGVATSADQAAEVGCRIGFPVAMKILSPDVIHKSDVGGVCLNLTGPQDVRDAFDLMMLSIGRRLPDVRLLGVYMERMCPAGREVILGMTRDLQFGPMLMFGLGGIFVEVMKDVAFHLAPITAQEALEMLRNTKSYALLEGARGKARVNVQGVADCLQRLSQLVTDFPNIQEMDINPLIVGEVGTDPMVADARITLRKSGEWGVGSGQQGVGSGEWRLGSGEGGATTVASPSPLASPPYSLPTPPLPTPHSLSTLHSPLSTPHSSVAGEIQRHDHDPGGSSGADPSGATGFHRYGLRPTHRTGQGIGRPGHRHPRHRDRPSPDHG